MGTRVSYPVEVKEVSIRLRMGGVPVAEVMERQTTRMTIYFHYISQSVFAVVS